ncbi:MAG: GGDEF domain-containing protein [Pseudomonadota bacterium]
MTDKHFSSLLILAILATLLAVIAVHYFPEKRYKIIPSTDARIYLDSAKLPDGSATSEWLDDSHSNFRCNVPPAFTGNYFSCSLVADLSRSATTGMNLENYRYVELEINYVGDANKLRIAVRNYNPAYSRTNDANSNKFNAASIHTKELTKPLRLPLTAFSVSDWWVSQYNIPVVQAQTEMTNALALTIDFADNLTPGKHDVSVAKLEFVGEWISPENWYLFILGCWMLGIFGFAAYRLIQLHRKTRADSKMIAELAISNEQLKTETDKFRRLSTVDALTQTYNRFGIDKVVTTLMAASHDRFKSTPNFALIIIDIDHFKRVNDRRGHDAGDRVLQKISAIIQDAIRSVDFLGRWGGEEFLVIMPNTGKEFAGDLAERIRVAISATMFEPEQPLYVTASFGIGAQLKDEDFSNTFKRVDNALFKAKELSRNCCVMAEDK